MLKEEKEKSHKTYFERANVRKCKQISMCDQSPKCGSLQIPL